jgi:Arc/MetJ-type ribon-helix-helix transcriptional regulator
MKYIVSVSLDQETIIKIRECLRNSSFKSKSRVVEEAVKRYWKGLDLEERRKLMQNNDGRR